MKSSRWGILGITHLPGYSIVYRNTEHDFGERTDSWAKRLNADYLPKIVGRAIRFFTKLRYQKISIWTICSAFLHHCKSRDCIQSQLLSALPLEHQWSEIRYHSMRSNIMVGYKIVRTFGRPNSQLIHGGNCGYEIYTTLVYSYLNQIRVRQIYWITFLQITFYGRPTVELYYTTLHWNCLSDTLLCIIGHTGFLSPFGTS